MFIGEKNDYIKYKQLLIMENEKDDYGKKFYDEYKRLGGKCDDGQFAYYHKVFIAITMDAYVGGECYEDLKGQVMDRETVFKKWIIFIGNIKEAGLFFEATDNVAAYS